MFSTISSMLYVPMQSLYLYNNDVGNHSGHYNSITNIAQITDNILFMSTIQMIYGPETIVLIKVSQWRIAMNGPCT